MVYNCGSILFCEYYLVFTPFRISNEFLSYDKLKLSNTSVSYKV